MSSLVWNEAFRVERRPNRPLTPVIGAASPNARVDEVGSRCPL
jgi:hypothetical protein